MFHKDWGRLLCFLNGFNKALEKWRATQHKNSFYIPAVLKIHSHPRTRMLVSKTDTTMSLSSLTSESTLLTAASNSVVLFKSCQQKTNRLIRRNLKNKHNKIPNLLWKQLTTRVSRVSISVSENLQTNKTSSNKGVSLACLMSAHKWSTCWRVICSQVQTMCTVLEMPLHRSSIVVENCKDIQGVTHIPSASSTSPRLGSRPRTLPLHVSGISSSAGYAWSFKNLKIIVFKRFKQMFEGQCT